MASGSTAIAPLIACRVTHSTTQSITQNAATAVAFDTEEYDYGGCHASANNGRLTAPISGVYTFAAGVSWATAAGSYRNIWVTRNSDSAIVAADKALTSTLDNQQSVSGDIYLAKDDYITVTVEHNSVAAVNIGTSTATNEFACWATLSLIGAA